jgi:hypothetical protein
MRPNEIRHIKTNQEASFTATGEKLMHHWPIFKKYRDTGHGSIIRATMTLHQVCASKCSYCSTIHRNKKDSISLDEAKEFVKKLYYDQADHNIKNYSEYNNEYKSVTGSDIRLRGLILSGGGQPNLWKYFSDFVLWLKDLNISVGLITNGFPKHVNDDVYKHFDWIRLSITPEDASPFYPNQQFDLQRIPENLARNTTFGISYVYGPWTTKNMITRLNDAAKLWNADYVRLLVNCNITREEQLKQHYEMAEVLYDLDYIDTNGYPTGKIFHQLKYHGTSNEANLLWDSGQCFLQSFNVFWDTTDHETNKYSYCYPCDSVTVLADNENDPERRFNYKRWGTVKNTQVQKLWEEPVLPYFDPRKECSSCLFTRNNQNVKDLINSDFDIKLDNTIKHINFP